MLLITYTSCSHLCSITSPQWRKQAALIRHLHLHPQLYPSWNICLWQMRVIWTLGNSLFSCYGITANCNMSPVGFAIVFGNKNGTTWKEFWNFVKEVQPTMNLPNVTIITDQDKGQTSAISEFMDQAGHFHCVHHRRGNCSSAPHLTQPRKCEREGFVVYECLPP